MQRKMKILSRKSAFLFAAITIAASTAYAAIYSERESFAVKPSQPLIAQKFSSIPDLGGGIYYLNHKTGVVFFCSSYNKTSNNIHSPLGECIRLGSIPISQSGYNINSSEIGSGAIQIVTLSTGDITLCSGVTIVNLSSNQVSYSGSCKRQGNMNLL